MKYHVTDGSNVVEAHTIMEAINKAVIMIDNMGVDRSVVRGDVSGGHLLRLYAPDMEVTIDQYD